MGKLLVFYVGLFSLLMVAESRRHGDMDMCPHFNVKKNTIIRTKDSKLHGAKMLMKQNVESARECYLLCCEQEHCNVAVMGYSRSEDDDESEPVQRKCYNFDCKEPSVCVFVNRTDYAVIELQKAKKPDPPEEEEDHFEPCPPGMPVAMCASDPCETASCDAYPNAKCRASFCGGCSAVFYDGNRRVKCSRDEPSGHHPVAPTVNAKVSLAASKSHTFLAKTQGVAPISEEEVVINPEDAGAPPTEKLNLYPATEDPHAVHEWRHFLTDGVPDGTFPPQVVDGAVPTASVTPKNPHSNVRYLDHGGTSVPLLIALVACILVLVAVIWRLRCGGRGKHSKKFAVDDGDYLINGMYL